jgi:ribose transport system substrate-binding protein
MAGTEEIRSVTSSESAMQRGTTRRLSLQERRSDESRPVATAVGHGAGGSKTGGAPFTRCAVKRASAARWDSTLRRLRVLGLVASSGLFGAAAQAGEGSSPSSQPDIGTMCGTKPIIFGLSDGYGASTWRKIVLEELKDELSHCTNVQRFIYSNANGDPQKANSDINSMIAQGVNVLIVDPDFGPSQIPSMRAAMKAGVTVVAYPASLPGKVGRDYSANITYNTEEIGKTWADWLARTVTKGKVIFLGGTAGVTSSQSFFNGFKNGLKNHPDLELLSDQYVVTNWNPVDAKKAAVGLIAKYGKIDGIATDYGVTALAVVEAFQEANLPVPAVATIASTNEVNCHYLADKKAGKAYPYFTLDGTTSIAIRVAARRAVSDFEGTSNDEPQNAMPMVYADSEKGLDPKCDPSAPLDADLSSSLPPEKLKAAFK